MRLWTDARDTLVLPTHCEQVVFKADPIEPRWWYVVQVAPRSRLVYEDLANTEIEVVVPSAQNNLLQDGGDSEEDEQQESRVLTAVVEEVEGNAESDDYDIDDDTEEIEEALEIDAQARADLVEDERMCADIP